MMMIFKPGAKVVLVGEVLNTYESDSSMMVRLSDGQAIHTQLSNGSAQPQEETTPGVSKDPEAAKTAESGAETPKTNTPAEDAKSERKRPAR